MPNYSFKNKKTGREFEKSMSNAEREEFLKNNPDVEQTILRVNIADSVVIGVTKPPSDFQKYVLGKIKAKSPGASAIANKRWNIPKEI